MQIIILSLPPKCSVESLTYPLSENESLTFGYGNGRSNHISLPDSTQRGSGDSGRIYCEQGRWYLESYQVDVFEFNDSGYCLGKLRPRELIDGDIIDCLGITMMVNDFSPWKTSVVESPSIRSTLFVSDSNEGGIESDNIIETIEEDMNDPFLIVGHVEPEEDEVDLSLIASEQTPASQQSLSIQAAENRLIDVLSDQNSIESNGQEVPLWTIQRQIKHQRDLLDHFPYRETEDKCLEYYLELDNPSHYFTQALLQALHKTLESLSPLNLLKEVKEGRGTQEGEKAEGLWREVKGCYSEKIADPELHHCFIAYIKQALLEETV